MPYKYIDPIIYGGQILFYCKKTRNTHQNYMGRGLIILFLERLIKSSINNNLIYKR